MGEMIQKPDTNPILIGALNLILAGGVGYFLMGQKKKAMYFIAAWVLSYACLIWIGLGPLVALAVQFIGGYDGYLLAQKLAAGESIGENENALPFLNSIIKD